MADNPYTSVTIAGFNQNPPPDDGTQAASNQLEWQKHVDKLASPVRTLSESINTNALSAFGALVMTDDPAQETVIGAMAEFAEPLMLVQRARRADQASHADSAKDLSEPAENAVVMMEEFN